MPYRPFFRALAVCRHNLPPSPKKKSPQPVCTNLNPDAVSITSTPSYSTICTDTLAQTKLNTDGGCWLVLPRPACDAQKNTRLDMITWRER